MSKKLYAMKAPEGATEQFCEEYIQAMTRFDFKALTAHAIGNCSKCAELLLKSIAKEYEGQEMLYTDGRLPIWIREEEEQKAREQAEAEEKQPKTTNLANKKELRNKLMGPEEIDAMIWEKNMQKGISDAALAYDLRKFKKMSDEEARKEVIALRRRKLEVVKERAENEGEAKSEPKEKKKEPRLPRGERCEQKKFLPWAPKLGEYFPQDHRSVLTDAEQKRIVAILYSYWNESKFRFHENKEDVKSVDKKLEEERATLNQTICKEFNPFQAGNFTSGPMINGYVSKRSIKRWHAAVGMSFHNEPIETVDWSCEIPESGPSPKASPPIETIHCGQAPKIRLPSLEDRLQINVRDVEQNRPVNLANRVRIEEDTTAFNICLEKGITIAMDATTASYLMTEPFVARKGRPKYIVSVRSQIHEGTLKKVIFISKPLHAGDQTSLSYLRTFAKHGFIGQYLEKNTRQETFEKEKATSLRDIVHNVEPTVSTAEETTTVQEAATVSGIDDPLGQIMTEMGQLGGKESKRASKAGKRYAIYKIGSQNVLIRSSAPMQCQTEKIGCLKGKGISIATMIEWLPNVGAMRLQSEELLFNYCKHIFKDSQAHCLVRIGVSQVHQNKWTAIDVLQIHALNAFTDPLSAEIDQNMKKMFAHRLGRMAELLGTVNNLENGFFLLQEMGGQMNISKELEKNEKSQSFFSIKTPYWLKYGPLNPDDFVELFEGIDHRAMLQWQVYINRVPGALIAPDCMVAKTIDSIRAKQPKRGPGSTQAQKRALRKKSRSQMAKRQRPRDLDNPQKETDELAQGDGSPNVSGSEDQIKRLRIPSDQEE